QWNCPVRLCKIRLNDGSLRVAALHSDTVQLLDLTQIDNCHSLMDILNSTGVNWAGTEQRQ
ncbi:MAG: hypothetical protein ACKOEO_16905, partial [Planctomycetaceae bacterium]